METVDFMNVILFKPVCNFWPLDLLEVMKSGNICRLLFQGWLMVGFLGPTGWSTLEEVTEPQVLYPWSMFG